MSEIEHSLEEIMEIEDASDQEQQEISDEKYRRKIKIELMQKQCVRRQWKHSEKQKIECAVMERQAKPVKRRSNGSDAVNCVKKT